MRKMFYEMEKKKFWKKCLQVARAQPKLSAEEVEFRAVLCKLGLCPINHG